MNQKITISILQYDINPDIRSNIDKLEVLFKDCHQNSIIVLPEMFNTGFDIEVESVDFDLISQSLEYLKRKSIELNSLILATTLIKEDTKFFNRLLAFEAGNIIHSYDKRHLFSLSRENKMLCQGKSNLSFKYKGIKIKTQICYDLRFPVWVRNTENYDLLIYSANWPARRDSHWEALLKARSIENQCFTIACNRIGNDTSGVSHIGNSLIFDYNGEKLICSNKEQTITYQIDLDQQQKFRKKFPFLNDKDDFKITSI